MPRKKKEFVHNSESRKHEPAFFAIQRIFDNVDYSVKADLRKLLRLMPHMEKSSHPSVIAVREDIKAGLEAIGSLRDPLELYYVQGYEEAVSKQVRKSKTWYALHHLKKFFDPL